MFHVKADFIFGEVMNLLEGFVEGFECMVTRV